MYWLPIYFLHSNALDGTREFLCTIFGFIVGAMYSCLWLPMHVGSTLLSTLVYSIKSFPPFIYSCYLHKHFIPRDSLFYLTHIKFFVIFFWSILSVVFIYFLTCSYMGHAYLLFSISNVTCGFHFKRFIDQFLFLRSTKETK